MTDLVRDAVLTDSNDGHFVHYNTNKHASLSAFNVFD